MLENRLFYGKLIEARFRIMNMRFKIKEESSMAI